MNDMKEELIRAAELALEKAIELMGTGVVSVTVKGQDYKVIIIRDYKGED
jgi:hypothetical protein